MGIARPEPALPCGPFSVSARLSEELERTARRSPHREVCGVLLAAAITGADSQNGTAIQHWRPVENLARDKECYVFDPRGYAREQERARSAKLVILGIYHSHPTGTACPSTIDEARARALWGQDTSWLYWIIGLETPAQQTCRTWQMQAGFWREIRLQVIP